MEVLLSLLYALLSFEETSLSFKSCLVRSTPLIRLKSSLFRWTLVGSLSFVSLCSFCSFQASLSFQSCLVRSTPPLVGLLLTFVRSLLSFLFAFFSFELRRLFRSSGFRSKSSFVSLCSVFV